MFTVFISIILNTISQLFSLFGLILVVGFLLGYLESKSVQYLYQIVGKKGYLLTAWIGTPIHELGHALMCMVFRHRIVKVQWFPIRSDVSYLGYVRHSYNQKSLYQKIGNFFIGIGPFISGILSLIILMYYFVPESYQLFTNYLDNHVQPESISNGMITNVFLASGILFKSLFTLDNLLSPYFWLFLLLAISISTHIALSKEDIKGAASGVLSIFILLFIFNLLGELLHFDSNKVVSIFASYNAYTLAFSSLAIMFSCMTLGSCFLLSRINKIER